MRSKIFAATCLAATLFFGTYLKNAECASVRMKVVVLNPSATQTQTKSIRAALPAEIQMKDIKDDGGLGIEYDEKQGSFMIVKNDIQLEPGETKVFEIIMDDVWMVAEDKLEGYRKRTESIANAMRTSKAYERVALVAEGIYAHIDQILKTQNNTNVTTNEHIAFYRDNVKLLEGIQKDIQELEKILVTAGGTQSLDAVENAYLNVKGPDQKTTWIIIFVILIFIGILGAVFFFTWQSQTGTKAKEKGEADSPFKENSPQ